MPMRDRRRTELRRVREGRRGGKRGILLALVALMIVANGCAGRQKRPPGSEPDTKKLGLAQLYLEAGKYPAAVTLLTELAKRSPHSAEIQYNLGVAQFGARDYKAAEQALKESLRLDP